MNLIVYAHVSFNGVCSEDPRIGPARGTCMENCQRQNEINMLCQIDWSLALPTGRQ